MDRQCARHRTFLSLGLVVLVFLSAWPVFGATITVTNTSDSGAGSLRDAIASAANGDTINFALSYPATITLSTPLTFGPSVNITGPGASNLTISGGDSVVVFIVNAGATVEISGLTVVHGSSLLGGGVFNAGTLTLDSVTVSNCTVGNQLGGGIFSSGTLNLNNSHVDGNVAGNAGSPGEQGNGGGIYNSSGTLTVTNSDVSNNQVIGNLPAILGEGDGGGIYINAGTLIVQGSTIESNFGVLGGGIFLNVGGTLTLTGSTVSANSSLAGGNGIYTFGTTTISGSTISGNITAPGGNSSGGGIQASNPGTLTVTNSTIWGNVATLGGGIEGINNEIKLAFVTIGGNTGVTGGGLRLFAGGGASIELKIIGSILASNGSSGNCSFDAPGGTESILSGGFNLSDDASCSNFLTQTGDVNGTPAGLSPSGLANNGGPTETVALVAGSPALNAIPVSPMDCTDTSGNAVTTDQRGVPRPQGPACDIGAFEFFQSRFTVLAVQTYSLIASVQKLPVPPPIVTDLTAPLEAAVSALNAGRIQPAMGQLGSFVNTVHGLVLDNVLTPQQASPLTTSAAAIIASLQGPGH